MSSSLVERCLCLLYAPRLMSLNGRPKELHFGWPTPTESRVIAVWIKRLDCEQKESLQKALKRTFNPSDGSRSERAYSLTHACLVAIMLHYRYYQESTETDLWNVLMHLGQLARTHFTGWSDYFEQYLEGASHQLSASDLESVKAAVEELLAPAGLCSELSWETLPTSFPSTRVFALQPYSTCLSCGRRSRVERFDAESACEHCRSPVAMHPAAGSFRASDWRDKISGMSGGLTSSGNRLCSAEPAELKCSCCSAPMDAGLLLDRPRLKKLPCPACGQKHNVRRLGAETRETLYGIEWFVGEIEEMPPVSAQGFVVTCDHCGDPLTHQDPSKQYWDCSACRGKSELPTIVRHALRPPRALGSIYAVAPARTLD